jgi:hypothetical protein
MSDKSGPIVLEGQEGEVNDQDSLEQMTKEGVKEASRAFQQLQESSSLLVHKIGEAVGLHPFHEDKENKQAQSAEKKSLKDPTVAEDLKIEKAQHHGDLDAGKPLSGGY